ncbi:hypothetical protein [Maricaulis sp. CAU 1757]
MAEFVSKRLLRLGWLVVFLIVMQLAQGLATPQVTQSRTAPLPPIEGGTAAL